MNENKPYVLLVEDDPAIAQLTAGRLTDLGCELKSVPDTRAARAAIKERVPALMLLDYKLPGENGLQFVQSFKARGEICPPFIVMTGNSDEEVAIAMLRAGARDYLVKGVSFFDPLKIAVKRVLEEIGCSRQLEAALLRLKESEEKLKDGQRLAKLGNWELDAATGAITGSEEYYRLFGLDPAQPMQGYEEHLKVYTPESAARLDAAVKATMRTGEPYALDLEFARLQGECLWVSVRGAAKRDARGQITGLHGSVQDITARKQAENAFKESEKRFMGVLYASSDPILLIDGDTFVDCNMATALLLGYASRDHVLMSHPSKLSPPVQPDGRASFEKANEMMSTAFKNGFHRFEWLHRKAGGEDFPVEVSLTPIVLAGKSVLYCVWRDITELKRAEAERVQIQSQLLQTGKMEAIGVLAGGVAHDFNNILTAISSYTGFIYKGLAPDSPMRGDAAEVLAAADRAAALTRQLLAFSRKQILAPQVVDLNKIIGDLSKMLKRLLHEDIELVIKLTSAPCTVLVDTSQMEQVMLNLVINARDAMPKGGTVTLETDIAEEAETGAAAPALPRGPAVRLRVQDTGSGMTDEVKSHIFEPFYTTKETGKGTGLGLSTVFGIVQQSNGRINVESAPGKGAAFSIYLPLKKDAVQTTAGYGPKAIAGKNTETVLLVEDDDMLRRLGERMLKELGYTVLTAANGKSALETMERYGKPVGLLLSDVVMPGMSGRELGLELERRKLAGRTLYMSGFMDDTMTQHGILEPGIAFINKPFSAEALEAKLCEVLDGPADKARA